MPPNSPSPLKKYLTVRITRHLYARLEKLARARKQTISDVVLEIVAAKVAHIDLTADELEQIARDIRNAERK